MKPGAGDDERDPRELAPCGRMRVEPRGRDREPAPRCLRPCRGGPTKYGTISRIASGDTHRGTTRSVSFTRPSHGTPVLAQTAGRSPRSRSSTRAAATATPGHYGARMRPRPTRCVGLRRTCPQAGAGRDWRGGRRARVPAGLLRPGRPDARRRLLRVRRGSSPTSTTPRSPRSATSTTSSASTGEVLDLMGSWVSHFRRPPAHLTVLGMNAAELAANPAGRRERRARPQRRAPACRSPTRRSTPSVCCVSVDYLTRPVEVFADVARALRPGGPFVCTFSNRCFPTKAIRGWLASTDEQHCAIVAEYFRLAAGSTSRRSSAALRSGTPAIRCSRCGPGGRRSD